MALECIGYVFNDRQSVANAVDWQQAQVSTGGCGCLCGIAINSRVRAGRRIESELNVSRNALRAADGSVLRRQNEEEEAESELCPAR